MHETSPLFVYADELFDGGMIKPLKVYRDSDPLLVKGKEEQFLKKGSHRKDLRSGTLSSRVFELSPNFSANIQRYSKDTMEKSSLGSRSWGHETISLGFRDRRNIISQVKKGDERPRKKEGISAHERHYIKNRRAGEEIKRKTFLPYKRTLLIGCSDLDPGFYEFCKGNAVEIKC
ncbi:hypothetical protein POM88_043309 [Heracleum sosnowskyi]|uniref:Uncharacterized protein n=1 Tax=Heracleum sosnowskyi TaxID=360622 RepID=A0AAD8H0U8_9APIA|nr:hypothetical protein POM88_043309 [Heracleum sosnowskyi]